MHNAAGQCDLIEVRLDRFDKAADIKELIAHKPKPIIMSCRRTRDGGNWTGSEAERLTLLRQCVIDKADYVEIELDVADDESVRSGTRYDALRILGTDKFEKSGARLVEYLADENHELQMGAVSGLADMEEPAAAQALRGEKLEDTKPPGYPFDDTDVARTALEARA